MTAEFSAQPYPGRGAFYLWHPAEGATASVVVQSRWGNVYQTRAPVRSIVVDVNRTAQILVHLGKPESGPAADRLPGGVIRVRACNLPIPPLVGRHDVMLTLGPVTDLVHAHIRLEPRHGAAEAQMTVMLAITAPGGVFGLDAARITLRQNKPLRATRTVQLLIAGTASRLVV